MKYFWPILIPTLFCLSLILALNTIIRESHKADAAAVSNVTGYLSGTNPVTLQDLVRCESVDPELVRRAMERINAAR